MTSENVVIATTTAPSSTVSPTGGGGSLSVLCPNTGAVVSSLRVGADLSGNALLGIQSISLFPQKFSCSNNNHPLALAYGQNGSKQKDTYGMLISVRPSPLPPIVHWKCRLPESQLTAGIAVSKCGYYAVGGGASGNCFLWSTLGGKLLQTFQAHYRACTQLLWSECGKFLVTGGADGMVHSFLVMDLVEMISSSKSTKKKIAPCHSWSSHHLPVTSLINLQGGRIASASDDAQLIIMELFSRTTCATIQLPSGISCLEYCNDGTIYVGSKLGDIFCIDLNAHAMRQHANATTAKRRRRLEEEPSSASLIFSSYSTSNSKSNDSSFDSTAAVDKKLKGHDHPVTSLSLSMDKGNNHNHRRLISGDALGVIRIWDLDSMTCLSMVRPWHNTAGGATKADVKTTPNSNNNTLKQNPISSLVVVPQPTESNTSGIFHQASTAKNQATIVKLLTPLSKFQEDETNGSSSSLVAVPYLRSKRTAALLNSLAAKPIVKPSCRMVTAPLSSDVSSTSSDKNSAKLLLQERDAEIESLQAQIERWKQVNNQLMAKLSGTSA